ncbi:MULTISPECIES: hypothetical protein [Chryseobacterium]|jgi:hypothetical protein|uniref:PH (Pleckstrin Homology) domain-containing protein n=1 Tax=Chryseobacterium geocarposphaerae TaxID=1416776 RepID=A0ABU1LD44_9FLAO|nr:MULTISPECIES: hypothetical protein [Chryseobacterium]MDR6404525.1 hypothetical protein [Chryseobacterium geocarposphaerae]MDR6698243.1 hypothetical protein [Chryseobacterium ginsenosidimutans]
MSGRTFQEKSGFPKLFITLLAFQAIVMSLVLINDNESPLIALYVTAPLMLLFAFSFLKLNLNKDYFEYNFFPFTFKSTKIKWSDIREIQIVNTDPIFDFGGWGVRLSKKYGKAFITGNNEVIFLKLNNGKRRSFSVKNKEDLLRFFDENKISYLK